MSSWLDFSRIPCPSLLVLLVLFAAVTGCGDGLVKFKATVTVDGEPYEGASVMFMPENGKGRIAVGNTAADGSVQFTSYNPFDGVKPGTYKVTVSKYKREEIPMASARKSQKADKKWREKKGAPSNDEEEPEIDQDSLSESELEALGHARLQKVIAASLPKEGTVPVTKALLPIVYASPKTTPFTCTVPHDGEVVFAVVTKGAGRSNRR